MNAEPLAFVVHVGDLGTRVQACEDGWLEARHAQLARIRHPVVVVPGDNEWSECHTVGADPLARLTAWRTRFCPTRLRVERQSDEYCEHLRWESGGYQFVTLNVPGNRNNQDHPEHRARSAAALAWLEQAAERAAPRKGLVVLLHANPFLSAASGAYDWLLARLAALGQRMPGRVLLIHGDTHLYKDDEPLPGVRRIEVWGAPFTDWHRIELP
jgi:hypothetical protein